MQPLWQMRGGMHRRRSGIEDAEEDSLDSIAERVGSQGVPQTKAQGMLTSRLEQRLFPSLT
jgi:hypothetical protein